MMHYMHVHFLAHFIDKGALAISLIRYPPPPHPVRIFKQKNSVEKLTIGKYREKLTPFTEAPYG